LRPARLLILDDATSQLDTLTERQITDTLTTVLTGRTRLLIARRAATAAEADLVAWLDAGQLLAVAPHRQLWQNPAYRAVLTGTPGDE
jgi:ATP-binding cassette subfamily B protein